MCVNNNNNSNNNKFVERHSAVASEALSVFLFSLLVFKAVRKGKHIQAEGELIAW